MAPGPIEGEGAARQHCCQGQQLIIRAPPKAPAKNAGQREELQAEGQPQPCPGPAAPQLPSCPLGAAMGIGRRGFTSFLGSGVPRTGKTKRRVAGSGVGLRSEECASTQASKSNRI